MSFGMQFISSSGVVSDLVTSQIVKVATLITPYGGSGTITIPEAFDETKHTIITSSIFIRLTAAGTTVSYSNENADSRSSSITWHFLFLRY